MSSKPTMDPPSNVEVGEVKADSITLTWTDPSDQQCQFVFVEYRMKQETEWSSDPVKRNQETVTLLGLESDTEYEIKVTAMSKLGSSVSSDAVTVVTANITINSPSNVKVNEVKADSITVTWRNLPDQKYQFLIVEYKMTQESEWTSDPMKKNQETVILSGLAPDTEYEIRVTAVSKSGYASSDVVTVMTAKTTMNPPTNVEVKEVKADSIIVTWRNPPDKQYQFIFIEYRMRQGTEWISDPVKKNQETATLSGMKKGTEYEIRVTAVSKLGSYVSSDVVTAMTAKSTMNPPSNVEVREVKADCITVTWKNPPEEQYQFLFIEYRMRQGSEWLSDPVKKNQETVTLSDLELDTEYEVKITTVDKLGISVSSDVVTAVTAKTTMNPPTNVEVTEVKADSIALTWRNPSGQQYQFLIIEYKMRQESEWTSETVKKTHETGILSGLELDTEYEIRVTAMSKLGSLVSSDVVTAVTTKTTMNTPTNVEVTEVKADSIIVTWRNPPGQQYQFLIVEYRQKHETEWTESDPMKKSQETATLSGLNKGSEYEIRVTAMSKLGCSVSSDVVTAVTAKSTMNPPTNVEVREVKADSIIVTWRNQSDQQYQFLLIEYRMRQESEWASEPVKKNQETVTLSGLKLGIEYEIRVTAVGKDCSVSSDAVTAITKAMSPPTNVEVNDVRTDSITLTWKNPPEQLFQSLHVEYKKKVDTEWTYEPVKKIQETLTLSGLEPDTEYEIRVTAVDKQGSSVRSEIIKVVTGKITMKPPTNLEGKEVKPDSITLTWRNTTDQQCRFVLIEYRMRHDTEWNSHPVQKNQETATLSELKPETEYEIRVTAVGYQNISVSSEAFTAVTPKTTISPPINVKVGEVKTNSITLTWINPYVQEYQHLSIEYRMKGEVNWTSETVQKAQETATLPGLRVNTEYEMRITALGKFGCSVSSDAVTATTTLTPPTNVTTNEVKADSITLAWSNHAQSDILKQYIIEYKDEPSNDWKKEETRKVESTFTLNKLECNTTYTIRICAEAGDERSEYGEAITVTTKEGTLDKNRFSPLPGNPNIYLLKTETKTTGTFKKNVFGKPSSSNHKNKTIMFVGATGSGKTTLINGMVNYILGVEWKDKWRFKLIEEVTNKSEAHSQTSDVTAYQIYQSDEISSEVEYSLTIIDTPGFGDTGGIKKDREITERIRDFFTTEGGIDSIDAVCFVVQASLARLTHTQKYIFDAIFSVFGKDIANNIITLITFADGQSPPVMEAIKEANIPCAIDTDGVPVHCKFNNSALFANRKEDGRDEAGFGLMFWKMGKTSMKTFFTQLGKMETQSLTLTKEVLQERKQLEATIEGVQPLIQRGLSTMEEIKTTKAILLKQKAHIKDNKDFDYEVEVEKSEKCDIPSGKFITNCHGCNYTCHYPCYIKADDAKHGCSAMKDEKCTVCPGKCDWNVHVNMTYRWKIIRVKEKKTYQELKSKYETAMNEEMNAEKILKQLEVDYDQVQGEVLEMMTSVTLSLTRLKEIALRPDPLSTPDYIDLLIESQKQEAKPGFQQRIQQLLEVKRGAFIVQKAGQDLTLTGEERKKAERLSIKTKAKGFVSSIWSILSRK